MTLNRVSSKRKEHLGNHSESFNKTCDFFVKLLGLFNPVTLDQVRIAIKTPGSVIHFLACFGKNSMERILTQQPSPKGHLSTLINFKLQKGRMISLILSVCLIFVLTEH